MPKKQRESKSNEDLKYFLTTVREPVVYLSRRQLAERIGVKEDTLNRYELPRPDVVIGKGDPRPKYGWLPETIDRWQARRPSNRWPSRVTAS